jgi:cation/acetate symporter
MAMLAPADPLMLLLWALALSAGTAFPLLVLSIWWKRLNGWGALAGLAAGFGVTVLAILAGEAAVSPVNSALAGVLGAPAAFLAAILVSRITPAPERHVLEMTRDLRMPGGETLFDREMRLLRLKQRQRAGGG